MDENNRIDLNNPKTVNDFIREAFDYILGDEYIEGEYQMSALDDKKITQDFIRYLQKKLKERDERINALEERVKRLEDDLNLHRYHEGVC